MVASSRTENTELLKKNADAKALIKAYLNECNLLGNYCKLPTFKKIQIMIMFAEWGDGWWWLRKMVSFFYVWYSQYLRYLKIEVLNEFNSFTIVIVNQEEARSNSRCYWMDRLQPGKYRDRPGNRRKVEVLVIPRFIRWVTWLAAHSPSLFFPFSSLFPP